MQPRNRGRGPSLGLLLLLTELFQASTQHGLPPVTLASIVAQIGIYLRAVPIPWPRHSACISAHKIIYKADYWKLFISQVEHGDDWHLYYNMISFMWKGKSLESRMGSSKFALLLAMFTGATGLTYVGLNYALAEFLEDDSYMYSCAVGFSGVIFALKVLTTHYDAGVARGPLGIRINSKYAVWVELIFISLISPNASFVGHLAGILVGLAYVYGPLKPLLDFVHGDTDVFNVGRGIRNSYSGRFSSSSQATGYATRRTTTQASNYAPEGMSEDEQIRRATQESLNQNQNRSTNYGWRDDLHSRSTSTGSSHTAFDSSTYSTQPTADELRRIRLQRYT